MNPVQKYSPNRTHCLTDAHPIVSADTSYNLCVADDIRSLLVFTQTTFQLSQTENSESFSGDIYCTDCLRLGLYYLGGVNFERERCFHFFLVGCAETVALSVSECVCVCR
jgi:hypothetical protein